MEPELQELLIRIGLSRYAPVFEEEAITDIALLKSIGSSGFVDAMSDLALDEYAAEALRAALFGPAASASSDEDELKLEVNEDAHDEDDGLMLEENAPAAPPPDLAAPVAPTPPPSSGNPAAGAAAGVPGSVSVAAGASEQAGRYKDEGNMAQQAGKYSEAAALYSKAIACDPRDAIYFSNRAAAYLSLRRFGEALADADQAVKLKPGWAKAHVRRGGALLGLGRPGEARLAFESACRLEPRNAQLCAMAEEAAEAAEAQAADVLSTDGGSDWVAVLNEEVRHAPFLEEAEEAGAAGDVSSGAQVHAEVYANYAAKMDGALDELKDDGATVLTLRSGARGVAVDIERVAGADGEALFLDGMVRRTGRRVRVRLWNLLTHYDWADAEGAPSQEDANLEAEMVASAERERGRLERLAGCDGWPGLVKELANETEAAVGVGGEMKRYPAVFTHRVDGAPLPTVLDADNGCGGQCEHATPLLLSPPSPRGSSCFAPLIYAPPGDALLPVCPPAICSPTKPHTLPPPTTPPPSPP